MQLTAQQGVYLLIRLSPSIPSVSVIHTSSGIGSSVQGWCVIQHSDSRKFEATLQSVALLTIVRMESSEVNIPQCARYFVSQKCHGTLWCGKPTRVCTRSAQLIFCARAADNPWIAVHSSVAPRMHVILLTLSHG